jgi:CubicO group peptidase (beta-lactamase class C family)
MKLMNKKLIESSYLARYFLLNAVDISDYTVFPSRSIANLPPGFHFSPPGNESSFLPVLEQIVSANAKQFHASNIDQFLAQNGTTAFIVVQNDKLLFERYYNGCQHSSIYTSFSTAKSFVSALIGIALQEGLIQKLDDPIAKYLPELTGSYRSDITIRHLVGMCSGLKYDSTGFFPWNDDPRIYYSLNLRDLARRARSIEAPGTRFQYNNYNLILLGMIIEHITQGSVSMFLQEKIWKPLGMEYPASWSLDSQQSGMEKMESGLNAAAIDYAKFGRLYLRKGDWDGRQIIPEKWVVESTTPDPDAKWSNYKYLWWIPRSGKGRFMAVGNLGQFIYLAPDKNSLIIRFGKGKPRNWRYTYPQLFGRIADQL